jgi:Flp pilus assembly protein TadD
LFLGALLSKTVTASVPAVLLVITWWKRGRISWRDVAPLVPFFAVGLALAYVTVWMEQTHVGAVGPEWDLSFVERTLIAGRAIWFYAGKLFFPYPLIFFYHRWTIDSGVWWQYLFPLSAVAVLVVLWSTRKRIGRGPLAAALIFGGVLLPALGYFNVYPFRFSFVADHFQYHASIALLALAAAAGVTAFERWTSEDSPLRVLAAGGLLLVLGAISQERTRAYRDLVTLYEDTLAKNPTSWAARFNLGESLLSQGKPDEGIQEIREAVRLSPEQPWLRTGLASALLTAGQTEEAEAEFRRALADPLHDIARGDALVRLGVLMAKKGNLDEAIDLFRQAIELRENNTRAIYNYGLALSKKGDRDAGIAEVRRALAIAPFDPEAQHGLGAMLTERGKLAEALVHLEQAVALHPSSAAYREDLGSALFTSGDMERAGEQLAEAVRLNPNSAKAHNLLGAVLAERGRANAAIREFEAALKLDPSLPGAARNLERARQRQRRSAP